MSKFAHFEQVGVHSLRDLYERHAEVSRMIHQDSLRQFTDSDDLTVDLVHENPLDGSPEVLESLSNYNVVSVSSGISLMGVAFSGGSLANLSNVEGAKQTISEIDMPIYVVAAGNEGRTEHSRAPRVSDFIRSSIVVGEATLEGENAPYIEAHSSRLQPTLASDSPFNNGVGYPYLDLTPSLDGHEKLVKDFVAQQEYENRYQKLFGGLTDENITEEQKQAYYDFSNKWAAEDYKSSPEAQKLTDDYLANPETLHTVVIEGFRQGGLNVEELDDGYGYVNNLEGTSFSGPEMAGYISGAMYEQSQREAQNLPILSKEELSSIARLATTDGYGREGEVGQTHHYFNQASFAITKSGGHGIFNPDMFRDLMDEAYNKIENNPNIARDNMEISVAADQSEFQRGELATFTVDNLETNMVVESVRYEFSPENGSTPDISAGGLSGEDAIGFIANHASESFFDTRNPTHIGWLRLETDFGEVASNGSQWTLSVEHTGDIAEASVTAYGYPEGSLLHQMMDYTQEITAKLTAPKPDVSDAPVQQSIKIPETVPVGSTFDP